MSSTRPDTSSDTTCRSKYSLQCLAALLTSSLWTVLRCLTQESRREKVRLQRVHLKGLSPVWVFQWR